MRLAAIIVEGCIRGQDELVTNSEALIGNTRGIPDREAGWVAVPLIVSDAHVAEEIEFFSWVVDVDIY